MLKITTAIVAVTVLCLQPASAAKLGGALSATESSSETAGDKESSISSFIYGQLKGSISLITSAAKVGVSDEADGQGPHTQNDCDKAVVESEENSEIPKANDQELAGPEPLYFGF